MLRIQVVLNGVKVQSKDLVVLIDGGLIYSQAPDDLLPLDPNLKGRPVLIRVDQSLVEENRV